MINARQHIKFGDDRSNCCRNMAVFQLIKMTAVGHFGFFKLRNFKCLSCWRANMRHCAKFCADRSSRLQIWSFVLFSRWRSSAISDVLYACLDHPWSILGGFYRCAKFGWNRHCSFEDMRFSICCALSLKMPIHAFWGVFWGNNGGNGNC